MFTGTVVLYTYEPFSVEMSSYSKGQGVPKLALLAFKKFLSTFFRLDPPNKFMCMCAHMCTGEIPEKGRVLLCFPASYLHLYNRGKSNMGPSSSSLPENFNLD